MLDIKNLFVTYDRQGVLTEAVRGVSFSVAKGEFAGLVGESGSGKSTMMTAILKLLPPGTKVAGDIRFEETNLLRLDENAMRKIRWEKIALIPQSAQNSFTPVLSIGYHIREVLRVHLNIAGRAAEEKIEELLTEVGLDPSVGRRYPHELSGGQKQRAAIALALACSPALLLADEPTTALDVITQAGILELLARLRREKGLTIVLITHDLPLAATVCDKLMVMHQGLLVETGTPDELVRCPRHAHTRALVDSIL